MKRLQQEIITMVETGPPFLEEEVQAGMQPAKNWRALVSDYFIADVLKLSEEQDLGVIASPFNKL